MKLIFWTIAAVILMIGFPWFVAAFVDHAGMIVCLLLFFAVNPIFSVACGFSAGKEIRRLWVLPIIVAGLFFVGAQLFFATGEHTFLWYSAGYLIIGIAAMWLSLFMKKRNH